MTDTTSPKKAAGTARARPAAERRIRWVMGAGLGLTVLVTVFTVVRTDALVRHLHAVYDGRIGPDRVAATQAGLVSYLYLLAALGVLGWLLGTWAVGRRKRWARGLCTALFVLGTCVAVLNLLAREYGQLILPVPLGIVGLLPCVAGLVAVVLLWRRGSTPRG